MNIHKKGKQGCEISIDHYKNVCKNAMWNYELCYPHSDTFVMQKESSSA